MNEVKMFRKAFEEKEVLESENIIGVTINKIYSDLIARENNVIIETCLQVGVDPDALKKTGEENKRLREELKTARENAVKEFADRLRTWAYDGYSCPVNSMPDCVFISVENINELEKDMLKENEQ